MLSETLPELWIKTRTQKNNRVTVLHIIKSLGRGGAETLLSETLQEHNTTKYEFHYIYFLPWKNQMVNEIQSAGGKIICIPAANNIGIFFRLFNIISYIKLHKIQLIHCHMPWVAFMGRLAGKITDVPVICTEHNKWERYHKLTYYINKFSYASQEKVIAVSQDVAASINKHYKKSKPPIVIIQNGINAKKFSKNFFIERNIRSELNIPVDSIVIGTACVFRKQKRLIAWLEVAKMLHERFSNTQFIIIGDGVLHEEIFAKAKELKMESYLHFAGLQTDVRPYLKALNIFMMTSEFEGLPIALLEAMSMECMPACTAAGGISELIKDNENGIIVPVTHPYELVDRLSELVPNLGRIACLGKAARKTVMDHFSMKKMVTGLEDIYDNLIK